MVALARCACVLACVLALPLCVAKKEMPTTGSDDLKALRAMSHKHATDASTTFGYMDRDYDKKVSLAELKSAYHGSHKAFGVDKYAPDSDDSVQPDFDELDGDGNGILEEMEFIQIMDLPDPDPFERSEEADRIERETRAAGGGGGGEDEHTRESYPSDPLKQAEVDSKIQAKMESNPNMRIFKMDDEDIKSDELPARYKCMGCHGITHILAGEVEKALAKKEKTFVGHA